MFAAFKRLNSVYVVPISIVVLALLNACGVFQPPARWLYDHASHIAYQQVWHKQALAAGIYESKPVLISIDEASLQKIGRWPWSRTLHAQLIKHLNGSASTPSLVALDIVFSEPQIDGVVSIETDEDAQLAKAINDASFPVVLAAQLDVVGNQLRLIQPRQPLSSSRATLAHVHIEPDVDGSVRRYWPIDDSFAGLVLPYLGKAMLSPELAPRIGTRQSYTQVDPLNVDTKRNELFYPMPMNGLTVLSYQAVLSGEVKASSWAGVPVLVAATAKGLGDQYVSPLYRPSSVLAGGELVLGAYHTERLLQAGLPHLSTAQTLWQWLSVLVCVGGVYFGLRRSSKVSRQIIVVVAALAAVWVSVLFALAFLGVWLNAALLGFAVILTWLLWVSHTLQRLLGFLLRRLQQASEPSTAGTALYAPSPPMHNKLAAGQDIIDAQLHTATELEERQKAEFKRLSQVLEMLPDAAFVLSIHANHDQTSRVGFQNLAARQLVQRFPAMQAALQNRAVSLNTLLSHLIADVTEQQQAHLNTLAQTAFTWEAFPALRDCPAFMQGVEANAPQDERFLVKLAYLQGLAQAVDTAHVVLSVVDLSVSKALNEAFERTLSFLSHDLRAPQATILALLALEGTASSANTNLFNKIEFQAQRTLQLAEGFVQWSQATHSAAYQKVEYNLGDLMVEALDEQWASAKQKNIALSGEPPDDGVWVSLDRNLMWRALVNLISNALNACHTQGTVDAHIQLSVRVDGDFGVIEISDNGPGIPIPMQAGLFQPFVQGQGLKRTGAGLGLAFVKTVLDQHHGQVRVHSPTLLPTNESPHGTRFELWLPLLPDEIQDEPKALS